MQFQKIVTVPIANLIPPARDLRDRSTAEYRDWLANLAADVKERGVRNPLYVVRRGDLFEIVAGETRRQASMLAGITEAPVIVLDRELSQGESLREQLLENEMRRNLTPIERAQSYLDLMRLNGWSQTELARAVFVATGYVSKTLAIFNKLPEEIRDMVAKGLLCSTAAYQLSRLKDPTVIKDLADKFVQGLLTRDSLAERVKRLLGKPAGKAKPVKIVLAGAVVQFTDHAFDRMESVLAKLGEAIRKAVKHGLPASALPSLLKGGEA